MIQRTILFLAAVFFTAAILLPVSAALADDEEPLSGIETPYYIVVDQNDPSVVLFERNADETTIPGSTMKIMTCILTLELCDDLDQQITATGQAATLKDTNSLMGVIKGETLTVRELLYGLMLESGNDAALLLALTFGGSVEGFAELMNEKAAALGMDDTNFVNASGAYKSGQYSTARDMAVLTCYAMQNEMFRTLVSTVNYTIEPNDMRSRSLKMTNSNKLISDPEDSDLFYPYATGVKTGSTELGGKCLVSSASRDGGSVVAVLMGLTEGGSKVSRMSQVYRESITLLDLALTTRYVDVSAEDLGITCDLEAPVSCGQQETVKLNQVFSPESIHLSDVSAEAIKADLSSITVITEFEPLTAPVREGDLCGTAAFQYNGETLFTAALTAAENVSFASQIIEISPAPTEVPSTQGTTQTNRLFALPAWEWGVILGVAAVLLSVALILQIRNNRRRKGRSRRSGRLR
ncbi:MAG TPA: D-alanyl-D-alanine carboxypeptidase family protein [Eubacteriales bacterium]|nr:D-alanyl-D-alanine carboxypeptidase family protein [Eubacteriales bacterium]